MQERFIGALMGGAIGDAAGYPAEGRTYEEVQGFGGIRTFYQPTWSGRLNEWIPAGRVTDGTILANVLAESLTRCNGVDLHDQVVQMYKAFRTSGQGRGWGEATVKALHNIRNGVPLNQCGIIGAAGNGTAERAAPLGLWHVHGSLEDIARDAALIAPLTHRDPRAVVGMALQAEAVRYLANCPSEGFNVKEFFSHMKEGAQWLEQQFSTKNDFLPRIESAERMLGVGLPEVLKNLPAGGYVPETVSFAFWVFGRHSTNIKEAVLEAANAGDDADSTALLAGNLVGALVGVENIPSSIIEPLEKSDEIKALGERLCEATEQFRQEKDQEKHMRR